MDSCKWSTRDPEGRRFGEPFTIADEVIERNWPMSRFNTPRAHDGAHAPLCPMPL
jgi:hypothetical protein